MATKKEQPAADEAASAAKSKTVRGLKVTCSKDGFWRGGIQWFQEPKIVRLDTLDNKQLALITKESRLLVEHVDVPAT